MPKASPAKPKKAGVKAPTETDDYRIKKAYSNNGESCKVTFKLPKLAAADAETVCIVGDFNEWSMRATPMKKLKNGDFSVTLTLDAGKSYQYRYLIDDYRWENDWNADQYVRSPFGDSDNSVVNI